MRVKLVPMSQKVAVSGVFIAAMFMSVMDITIVNVAIPTLGHDFHRSESAVDLVVTSFLVSLAVFIPASGWLGDRFGGKPVLLSSIFIFTLASVLCGIAWNLDALVAFRVLQGAGGGLMTPVGLAMLFRVFPAEERVRASSILIIPTAFAPALGPVLGGLLVTDLSWRWVFLVNAPIGAGALVFGWAYLENSPQHNPGRFDMAGFLTAGLGLGSLMLGISEGPSAGWGSPLVTITIAAGLALLAWMTAIELRATSPLLDLRLYTDRLFRVASIVLTLGSLSFLGVLYLIALFLQDALGLSALQSGLTTFPEAVGLLVGSQLITRVLHPRFGTRRVVIGACLTVAVLLCLFTLVTGQSSLWVIRLLMLAVGFCISGVFIPTQAAAFTFVEPERMGRASTLFNSQRQLGGAAGVAVLTTVISLAHATHQIHGHTVANLGAYRLGFLVAAVSMLGACASAVHLARPDCATPSPRGGLGSELAPDVA